MPLLPALQPIADLAAAAVADAPVGAEAVAAARAQIHEMMHVGASLLTEPSPRAAAESDHPVAVDGGTITVRTYRPAGPGPFPLHLFLHGGGFWLGTLDHSDDVCRALAADTDCVVASVDYRLAPEVRFPVPVEDCYAALIWAVAHAAALDVDARRVSIGGESAGANLAAAVTLAARARGGPHLAAQVLEIPLTDMTLRSPSVQTNADAPGLTAAELEVCVARYLAAPAEATDPHASPLLAEDHRGLPRAFIAVAELDPIRDDGIAYADRLRAAEVPVELLVLEGQFHGSQRMAKVIPDEAAALRDAVARFLRHVHHA